MSAVDLRCGKEEVEQQLTVQEVGAARDAIERCGAVAAVVDDEEQDGDAASEARFDEAHLGDEETLGASGFAVLFSRGLDSLV